MIQLNATYRSIEESIGRLLPQQTKEQLSLLEALVRCEEVVRVPSRAVGFGPQHLGGLSAFCLETGKMVRRSAEKAMVTSSDSSCCLARTAGAVQGELVR